MHLSQDSHLAGADQVRIAPQEELCDTTALVGLVVGDQPLNARPVGPVRHERARLIGGGEHVHAGGDDLRRAPMVDRQPDHLDAGEEPVELGDRLRPGLAAPATSRRRVDDGDDGVLPAHG